MHLSSKVKRQLLTSYQVMTSPNVHHVTIWQCDANGTGNLAGFNFAICNLINDPIVCSSQK